MKKITKILDSVMSGLKRTCVAKAIAVFAVATIAMNSFAQEVETITGVKDLPGKDLAYINSHLTTDGNYPAEKGKMFFLYNEKTGKFLNLGSYWGTHVALADYGKPLWVIKGTREICLNPDDLIGKKYQTNEVLFFAHNMATTLSEDQGPYVGWSQINKKKPAEDRGVFADRENTEESIYGWELEFTGNDMKTCKLKTNKTEETYGIINKHYCWSDDVYLCGVLASVDPNRSCEAYSAADIKSKGLTGYDTWRIMTYEDIYNLQNKNTENMTKSIDLSFMLKTPGFQRGDNDIANWKTYNFATQQHNENNVGFASFGLNNLYSKAANWDADNIVKGLSKTAYTFDNRKYTTDSIEPYQRHLGKFYCASIKSNRGIVYQDVTVKLAGTYVVECKGFSTTDKAALVAGVLNPNYGTNNEPMMIGGVLNRTTLSQTSNMTADEQTRLHISEMNMDYAGKEFYEHSKYTNSVVVVVPQSAIKNGSATIRLGVMVGSQSETAAQAGEWTVFDDFRLLYASKNTEADLILDQDRADLSYILDINEPLQNKTLRLNKTFTAHKWNTLVLPVNLTLKQLRDAFGPSTRLAQLEKLTESGIQFQSVDFTDKADDYVALQAYKPYLIIPEKAAGQAAEYTSVYVETGASTAEYMRVKIAANHFVIPKVSLSVEDLKKVNKNTWATAVSTSTDHKMEAWGTLARTFGTVNEDVENGYQFENNGQIITGRDNLIGSYFFANGKMYHSSKDRVRGLRGFSCWFKPVNGKSQNASFTLDGVTQSGTTALDDIFADGEQTVSRFANGVYNLNGQLVKQGNSTAGLPSGLYIVNGKKCIVR